MKHNVKEIIGQLDWSFVDPNVYVSPDEQFTFVYIPKNASSWAKNVFTSIDWNNDRQSKYPNAQPLVIIRDPIERWVSGIAQYLLWRFDEVHGKDLRNLLNNKMFWELIFTQFQFDPHSMKQSTFITQDVLKRAIFFKFEEGTSKVVKYLNAQGYQIDPDIALTIHNPGDSDPRKQVYKSHVSQLLEENSEFRERLEYNHRREYAAMPRLNYYKEDQCYPKA